jgi:hypothetical protein
MDYLAEIKNFRHPGAKNFPSPHPGLRRHMEAAFQVAGQPPLPNPEVTGTMASGDVQTLWTIISFVGTNWNLSQYSTLQFSRFQNDINLKTQQTPSYFTAYQEATALFTELANQLGSQEAALVALYTPTPPVPEPANWDVVRDWVIQEFITLFVVRGGFLAYGWWLYPGFGGGPFSDPNNLPYRGLSND